MGTFPYLKRIFGHIFVAEMQHMRVNAPINHPYLILHTVPGNESFRQRKIPGKRSARRGSVHETREKEAQRFILSACSRTMSFGGADRLPALRASARFASIICSIGSFGGTIDFKRFQ